MKIKTFAIVILILTSCLVLNHKLIYSKDDMVVVNNEEEKTVEDTVTAEYYLNLGDKLMDNGDLKGAVEQYSLAISVESDCVDALFQRGFAFMRLKQFDEAIFDFNHVLELDQNDELAYSNLGVIYRDQGDYNNAEKYFKEALRINKSSQNYCNFGSILMKKGEYAKARAVFDIVLSSEKENSYFYNLAKKKIGEIDKLEKNS